MENAPETPDTFHGYPCRVTQRFKNILHLALIIDERWLLAMFQRRYDTGLHKVILYNCKVIRASDTEDRITNLVEVAEEGVADELGAFNWARKKLEELDGRPA